MTDSQYTKLTGLVNSLGSSLAEHTTVMNKRFDKIEEHLKDQDQQIKDQDLRFNAFADAIGERFEQIDNRLDRLETKIDKLEVKVDRKADGGTVYDKLRYLNLSKADKTK